MVAAEASDAVLRKDRRESAEGFIGEAAVERCIISGRASNRSFVNEFISEVDGITRAVPGFVRVWGLLLTE
jgi:hypothetical protein